MKLMLTSFGTNTIASGAISVPGAFDDNLFLRMPPAIVNLEGEEYFAPDYAALMLCDEVTMDVASYLRLQNNPHPLYQRVARVVEALEHEGFVRLVDYSSLLRANQPLLDKMLEHDLAMVESWYKPLWKSLMLWYGFAHSIVARDPKVSVAPARGIPPVIYDTGEISGFEFEDLRSRSQEPIDYELSEIFKRISNFTLPGLLPSFMHDTSGWLNALKTSLWPSAFTDEDLLPLMRDRLTEYLSYVNGNIVLSNVLGMGFHDWADYSPFYDHKFLSVGRENMNHGKQVDAAHQLFQISFPELSITSPSALLKVIRDKRVVELRHLVDEAAMGRVQFDHKFAKRTLWEVLGRERRASRRRTIVAYLAQPLNLIPSIGTVLGTALQLGVSEGASTVIDRKLKDGYQWFYLLSEAASIANPIVKEWHYVPCRYCGRPIRAHYKSAHPPRICHVCKPHHVAEANKPDERHDVWITMSCAVCWTDYVVHRDWINPPRICGRCMADGAPEDL
jgi:hypothetical protein